MPCDRIFSDVFDRSVRLQEVMIVVIRSESIVSFLSRPNESIGLLILDSSSLETI